MKNETKRELKKDGCRCLW